MWKRFLSKPSTFTHHKLSLGQTRSRHQSYIVPEVLGCLYDLVLFYPVSHKQILLSWHLGERLQKQCFKRQTCNSSTGEVEGGHSSSWPASITQWRPFSPKPKQMKRILNQSAIISKKQNYLEVCSPSSHLLLLKNVKLAFIQVYTFKFNNI